MGLVSPRKVLSSRTREFILFQGVFWGLFLLMRAAASARYYPELFWAFMAPRVAVVLVYVAGTTIVHLILRRVAWRPVHKMGLALALCAALIFPMHVIEGALTRLYAPPNWPSEQFLDYVSQFGWVFVMWAGYYLALDHAYEARRQADEAGRAQAEAHAAQLKMLRYQLNPHFLFNSLNAISTLVLEKRNGDAENMILKLSRFLRHMIDTDPDQFSRLADEAAIQSLYLQIEAERFGDRLRVICEVPAELHDCLVPSLIIQPAVENAIKHGVAHCAGVGRIRIACAQHGERLITVIEDNGPGPPPSITGKGVGLRNTKARLAAIYGDDASVTLAPRPEGGARVTLDVPLQRAFARKRAPACAEDARR